MRPFVLISVLLGRDGQVVADGQPARIEILVGLDQLSPEFGVAVIVLGEIPKRIAVNDDMGRRCRRLLCRRLRCWCRGGL
jgi:hypothetical protein